VVLYKKTRHVKPGDPGEYGEVWTWIATDKESRLRIASVCGKRTQKEADLLVEKVRSRLDPGHPLPAFSSDQLDQYTEALKKAFGREIPDNRPRRGPKRKHPRYEPLSELRYGQLVKREKEEPSSLGYIHPGVRRPGKG